MWLAAARRAIIARLGATLGPNEPEKINHEDKQWPVDMTTPPPCDVSRVTWLVTLRPPPPSHHDQCQGILACGEWTYSGLWRDLQILSSSIHTLLHPLLIYSGNSAISRNIIFSHLSVLWTTSAALSLLSWFRLLSLAHSRVMDRPAGGQFCRDHDHEDPRVYLLCTWHEQHHGHHPHHRGEHHGGEAVVIRLHQNSWQ